MVDKVDADGEMNVNRSIDDARIERPIHDQTAVGKLAEAIDELRGLEPELARTGGAPFLPLIVPLPIGGAILFYFDTNTVAFNEGERNILAHFAEELHLRAQGVAVLDANAVLAIAERAAAAVPIDKPAASIPNQLVGPFYDAHGLSKWLGITRQAIHKRNGSTLLALHTRDGSVVYPSFQFMADGSVVPNLMSAVAALKPALPDPWGQAQWINTKVSDLGDRSVTEVLTTGRRQDTELAMWWVRTEAARLAA
jgi:hypothetical protein